MDVRRPIFGLAVVLVLAGAPPAVANTIAPTAYFWPGVLPLTLGLALPASVLAAVLERPFVSRAGVSGHALWYSLQANFVSLLIGYATLPCAGAALSSVGPLWSAGAVAVSVVSEGLYYEWRAVRGQRLRWGWVIGGNLFSSVVILLIPYLTLCLKEAQPDLEGRVEPYHDGLWWASVGGSVLVFALSFRVPGWRRTQPEHGTVLGAFASPEPPGADSKLGSP